MLPSSLPPGQQRALQHTWIIRRQDMWKQLSKGMPDLILAILQFPNRISQGPVWLISDNEERMVRICLFRLKSYFISWFSTLCTAWVLHAGHMLKKWRTEERSDECGECTCDNLLSDGQACTDVRHVLHLFCLRSIFGIQRNRTIPQVISLFLCQIIMKAKQRMLFP